MKDCSPPMALLKTFKILFKQDQSKLQHHYLIEGMSMSIRFSVLIILQYLVYLGTKNYPKSQKGNNKRFIHTPHHRLRPLLKPRFYDLAGVREKTGKTKS